MIACDSSSFFLDNHGCIDAYMMTVAAAAVPPMYPLHKRTHLNWSNNKNIGEERYKRDAIIQYLDEIPSHNIRMNYAITILFE